MNTNRIFLRNIMCGNEFLGTTVFVKFKDDLYVALDRIDTLIDVYKINHNKSNIMTFSTSENEHYYIDKNSLTPYYEKQKQKQKTLKKIKFDVLLDPRNPSGIDH